jgi:hypothetical protein
VSSKDVLSTGELEEQLRYWPDVLYDVTIGVRESWRGVLEAGPEDLPSVIQDTFLKVQRDKGRFEEGKRQYSEQLNVIVGICPSPELESYIEARRQQGTSPEDTREIRGRIRVLSPTQRAARPQIDLLIQAQQYCEAALGEVIKLLQDVQIWAAADGVSLPEVESVEASAASSASLRHSPDYRWIKVGEQEFSLTPRQGKFVEILHLQHQKDVEWVSRQFIAEELQIAGELVPEKIRDIFKSWKGAWKKLIEHSGTGQYRLRFLQ